MLGQGALSFLLIHSIIHKFNVSSDTEIKVGLAKQALELMDFFQALHPLHDQLRRFLAAYSDKSAFKYDETWVLKLEQIGTQELFMGDEFVGHTEKLDLFEKFVPQFQRLFIACDFANLQNLINKVTVLVHFLGHCSDVTLFTENRYFEFLFYQIIALVYGHLWFPQVAKLNELNPPKEEASPSLKWNQLRRKCDSYSKKTCLYAENLEEQLPEVVEKVKKEFDFQKLTKWFCAFAKFKENRFTQFCEDFEALQETFHFLEELQLLSQALICYGVASIASKPFKEVNFLANEQVLDLFTQNSGFEAHLYDVMCKLSSARFTEVKKLWDGLFLAFLDSQISYMLPLKTKGTFWDYLMGVIDVKAFLLILSISEGIPREKMLDKLGYKNALEEQRKTVSNTLIVALAVLDLGESNVFYHQTDDVFYNRPLGPKARENALLERLESLDHDANAEAAAAQMKMSLLQKYFT